MLKEILIPELGENISSATVAGILVHPGDAVTADQGILEVEAGKATVEIPAGTAGVVKQLLVSEGDEVKVGQAVAQLDLETKASTSPATPSEPERQPESVSPLPRKTTPAETITRETEIQEPEPVLPPEELTKAQPVTPEKHVPAAPSVRRFAREIGIDVDTVKGSGPHGRVSLDDVKRHARELNRRRQTGMGHEQPPLPDFSRWGGIRRERMSAIRMATARQVSTCWNLIPRVTHFDEADITGLEILRKRYADRAAAAGGKLTMAVMVVKVVAAALRKFPRLNASIDMEKREIVYKDYVNIGIAVATDRGLMVPVLHNADRKNMIQLAAEIDQVAKKCREGKIQPAELEGGTFTVTNLGSIGGSHFTPIVNYPEVAILGLGRSARRPVVRDDDTLGIGLLLPLSLSYDHRLIDGADAARFVRWIVEAIQEPLLLSLEGEN